MTPWFPKAQSALQSDPIYSKTVKDEWWESVPLPDALAGKPFVVIYAGLSKRRPTGGRSPDAPSLVVFVSYPEAKVTIKHPPAGLQPTPEDDAKLDDPKTLDEMRKNLATRGNDMIRHRELLDAFFQEDWWMEHEPKGEHHDVAREWDGILSRILLPNYSWLYSPAARFLRQWIDRNR